MNTFPADSYQAILDGANGGAYFTWADSPGMLMLIVILVYAISVLVIGKTAMHENEVAEKHK